MDVFVEILNGIGRLLLQPRLYVGILLAILFGFNRVKWERKSFSISIYSPWLELKNFFGVSLLFGLAISVITSLIGFGVMIEWVAIFNVVACFLLIVGMFRLSSTAFTIGITSLIFYFCYYFDVSLAPFTNEVFTYDSIFIDNFMISMTFLLAVLLFVEAFLIQYTSAKNPSPSLRKSKRGKLIGSFQLRKLWFVPIVMFVPGDVFTKIFEWWPVFAIGSQSYSLIILPLFIGFQQQVQTQLPEEASRKIAIEVTTLATIIAVVRFIRNCDASTDIVRFHVRCNWPILDFLSPLSFRTISTEEIWSSARWACSFGCSCGHSVCATKLESQKNYRSKQSTSAYSRGTIRSAKLKPSILQAESN